MISEAISPGCPRRPIGCLETNHSLAAFFEPNFLAIVFILSYKDGVSMVPGHIALHRMLSDMKSTATDFVRPMTAALDAL